AHILRPGGVTRDAVAATLAAQELTLAAEMPSTDENKPASPGQLASHYAPSAPVRLNVTAPEPGMELIGFGETGGAGELGLNLSPKGDLQEAAANLFDMMHAADATGATVIGVAPVPGTGLGEAVNDRLRRAAAPRTL
ncbi:MAG TPA: translation factor Sua5, partial [Alphaproteobacteria bacterium]|nr:translation factor Sua5 [Alphaproteobacteria bacterium]